MMIYYLQLFFETHFTHIGVSGTIKLINDFPSKILLFFLSPDIPCEFGVTSGHHTQNVKYHKY